MSNLLKNQSEASCAASIELALNTAEVNPEAVMLFKQFL